MRRLLSAGALVAAAVFAIWQPAIAARQVSVIPVGFHGSPGYVFHGRHYSSRVWVPGRWWRGRFIPGHWRYYR